MKDNTERLIQTLWRLHNELRSATNAIETADYLVSLLNQMGGMPYSDLTPSIRNMIKNMASDNLNCLRKLESQ